MTTPPEESGHVREIKESLLRIEELLAAIHERLEDVAEVAKIVRVNQKVAEHLQETGERTRRELDERKR